MVDKPLVIGQFVSHYPYPMETDAYFTGGTGEVARGLSTALATAGHQIRVFCVAAGRHTEHTAYDGLHIHRSGSHLRIAQANLSASIFRAPFEQELDLVHVHAGNPPAPLAGAIYAKRRNVPLIVTYHGDPQTHYGSVARRVGVFGWEYALRWILRRADGILCPSAPFVQSSRLLTHHHDRVIELPNGIDAEALTWHESPQRAKAALDLPADGKVILFLGSLSPYKAPEVLLQACIPVLRDRREAVLVFAGAGTLEAELKRQARACDVSDRIKFLGFVTGERRLRAFRAADVFVLPSVMTTEVFPMVLLEASSFGLPLVVSDLPTFAAQVTDGENGLVTRRGDPMHLGMTIARLLDDRLLRSQLGAAARARIKGLTWTAVAARHAQLYRDLLAGHRDAAATRE